jgi:uncharacterized protein
MLTVDLELARAYVAHNPPPGTLLLCGVTGAHLYGFPSPNSDLDLKGIHLANTGSLLGINPMTPPHDHTEIFQGVECDLTTNEASDALRLLVSGNGNMLERILSPLQVHESTDLVELRSLAVGSLSRRYARHYGGFFRGMRRELNNDPTVKSLLYAYRVALTGIHLLTTGEVEPNVNMLAPQFGLASLITELVAQKRSGDEHAALSASAVTSHDGTLDYLANALLEAEAGSPLPIECANTTSINSWLIERRLRELRRPA